MPFPRAQSRVIVLAAMPTTSHLEVLSPSSTTVEYVVSSKRKPASRALLVLQHGLRIVFLAHLILLDLCKAQTTGLLSQATTINVPKLSLLDPFLRLVAEKVEWWALGIINLTTVFLCLRRAYIGKHFR